MFLEYPRIQGSTNHLMSTMKRNEQMYWSTFVDCSITKKVKNVFQALFKLWLEQNERNFPKKKHQDQLNY